MRVAWPSLARPGHLLQRMSPGSLTGPTTLLAAAAAAACCGHLLRRRLLLLLLHQLTHERKTQRTGARSQVGQPIGSTLRQRVDVRSADSAPRQKRRWRGDSPPAPSPSALISAGFNFCDHRRVPLQFCPARSANLRRRLP